MLAAADTRGLKQLIGRRLHRPALRSPQDWGPPRLSGRHGPWRVCSSQGWPSDRTPSCSRAAQAPAPKPPGPPTHRSVTPTPPAGTPGFPRTPSHHPGGSSPRHLAPLGCSAAPMGSQPGGRPPPPCREERELGGASPRAPHHGTRWGRQRRGQEEQQPLRAGPGSYSAHTPQKLPHPCNWGDENTNHRELHGIFYVKPKHMGPRINANPKDKPPRKLNNGDFRQLAQGHTGGRNVNSKPPAFKVLFFPRTCSSNSPRTESHSTGPSTQLGAPASFPPLYSGDTKVLRQQRRATLRVSWVCLSLSHVRLLQPHGL